MIDLPFKDRSDAGRRLGSELVKRYHGANALVLALPRGGVAVGVEVAEALDAPLDVMVVRKLGVPWQPELAMGAIAGGTRILNDHLIRAAGISDQEVEMVVARETQEIARREKLYRNGLPAPNLGGRTILLVDDGLATGSTMVAAARLVRNSHPEKLIVAVPVGTREAYESLKNEADECLCLALPDPFYAVGKWYADFRQITDAEVREMLERSHSAMAKNLHR